MLISGKTPAAIQKTLDKWQWKMENVNGRGSAACDLNPSGVHTVYTILDEPTAPWENTVNSKKNAWTKILDYSCVWAAKANDETTTVAKITTGANSGFGKTYNGQITHTPNMCHLSKMLADIPCAGENPAFNTAKKSQYCLE